MVIPACPAKCHKPFFRGLQQQVQARGCLRLQHRPIHLIIFPSAMNNSLFPLQWPPAPVADTSVSEATCVSRAGYDSSPGLPSCGLQQVKQARRCLRSQHRPTHLSFTAFSLMLPSVSHPKPLRPLFSVRLPPLEIVAPAPLPHSSLLHLKSQYPLLQQHHCLSHQMPLPRSHR